MRALHVAGETWAVEEKRFSPALVAAARGVPGMAFDRESKQWRGSYEAVVLTMQALVARGLRVEIPRPPAAALDFTIPLAEKDRRPYQLEAVRFLLTKKRALLGDAMGLGKTCTAITAARALNARTLIVCPSYVRGVWFAEPKGGELQRWWPHADVRRLEGRKNKRMVGGGDVRKGLDDPEDVRARVLICSYDLLDAWAEFLEKWRPRVCIFDEAHVMQSERSLTSQAARKVASGAEMVWGLTGTPLTNRPRDLWNVADIISPGVFGRNFFGFGVRYCNGHKEEIPTHPPKTVWKFDGKSNLDELGGRLKGFMLRRTVADVGIQLPPKTRQTIWVNVPPKACISLAPNAAELRRALDTAADAKLEDGLALIRAHVEAGRKVVVFTWRRSVAEFICDGVREGGGEAELVHGGVSSSKRGAAIARAKGSKSGHALCATIDTAGTGIDLTYANGAVFLELCWEPHKLLQAEARVHRFGASAPVLVQYIVARGSVDEILVSTVIGKLHTFETVVGATGEQLESALKEDDAAVLKALFSAVTKMQTKKGAR